MKILWTAFIICCCNTYVYIVNMCLLFLMKNCQCICIECISFNSKLLINMYIENYSFYFGLYTKNNNYRRDLKIFFTKSYFLVSHNFYMGRAFSFRINHLINFLIYTRIDQKYNVQLVTISVFIF